jgi:hypothetical protein
MNWQGYSLDDQIIVEFTYLHLSSDIHLSSDDWNRFLDSRLPLEDECQDSYDNEDDYQPLRSG